MENKMDCDALSHFSASLQQINKDFYETSLRSLYGHAAACPYSAGIIDQHVSTVNCKLRQNRAIQFSDDRQLISIHLGFDMASPTQPKGYSIGAHLCSRSRELNSPAKHKAWHLMSLCRLSRSLLIYRISAGESDAQFYVDEYTKKDYTVNVI